jgi:hypothetical protein
MTTMRADRPGRRTIGERPIEVNSGSATAQGQNVYVAMVKAAGTGDDRRGFALQGKIPP